MTLFAEIMETLHEAERGARLWDGDRLRAAALKLSALAAGFPLKECKDCGHDAYWHDDVGEWFHRDDVSDRGRCSYGDGPVEIEAD